MVKRKCFDFEESARKFAKEVGGTVYQRCLPNYMWVDIVWVVEWEVEG